MSRLPHNIHRDILSVYQRPPYLPSSDSSSLSDYTDKENDDDKLKPVEGEDVMEAEQDEEEEEEEEEAEEEETTEESSLEEEEESTSEDDASQEEGGESPPKWTWNVKKENPQGSKDKPESGSTRSVEEEDSRIEAKEKQREKDLNSMIMGRVKLSMFGESEDEDDGKSTSGKEDMKYEVFSDDSEESIESGLLEEEGDESSSDLYELMSDSELDKYSDILLKRKEFNAYETFSDDRIDAGEEKWSDGWAPKSLAEHALRNIGRHLELYTETPLQDQLTPEDWNTLIEEEVPLDKPLSITVPMIPDCYYWEKACRSNFKALTCYEHGDSWKRMFLELSCQEYIENLVPSKAVESEIRDLTELWEPYVLRLVINQLTVEPVPTEEEGIMKWSHIKLRLIIPDLAWLEEIHIRFGMNDCGLQFEWYKFAVSNEDVNNLTEAIENLTKLKIFKLHHSLVKDEMCETLWDSLKYLDTITELHFTHTLLGDGTAKALAELMTTSLPNLRHLDLRNNQIGAAGAKSIAQVLASSQSILRYLNLSLNSIEDSGGQFFVEALQSNQCLHNLHLAGCSLTEETFVKFASCLEMNATLKELNLSNNVLDNDPQGTLKILMGAFKKNHSIQVLDLRMTGINDKRLTRLWKLLDRNRGMAIGNVTLVNPRFKEELFRYFDFDGGLSFRTPLRQKQQSEEEIGEEEEEENEKKIYKRVLVKKNEEKSGKKNKETDKRKKMKKRNETEKPVVKKKMKKDGILNRKKEKKIK